MPPFSATSWTTLVRRAVQTARHGIQQKARAGAHKANIHHARAVRLAIQARFALLETFPTLGQPTFPKLALKPIPLYNSPTAQAHAHALRAAARRVGAQPFRMPAHALRGGAVGNVGIGSARTFASSASQQAAVGMHMFLRPFAGMDEKKLNKSSRRSHGARRPKRSTCRQSHSQCSSSISAIERYFPRIRAVPTSAPLPPAPEQLITPGKTTTLSIALAPSLTALLIPTTEVTYAEAEIGRSVFASLLPGLIPLTKMFATHASVRVMPLLYKLSSLGVLEPEAVARVRLEPELDYEGRPEVLRIVFEGRSIEDVRELLGEMGGEGEWFMLGEAEVDDAAEVYEQVADTWAERSAAEVPAVSGPAEANSLRTAEESTAELVMPRIDIESWQRSISSTDLPNVPFDDFTHSANFDMAQSWTSSSGFGSVGSVIFDQNEFAGSDGSDGFESPPWSITPSEADDLESYMSEMEWSEHSDSVSSSIGALEEVDQGSSGRATPDIWMSGYGFVQPW